ncbi:MAG: TonB-dependent receptor [Acidobacteriaceae bacterium]
MNAVREISQIHPPIPSPNQIFQARRVLIALVVLILAGLYLPSAYSQAVYGTIFGTVTDPTGAVIPNATITVTDISKNVSVTAKTNGSGDYQVQHLIPDVYRVQATATGFNAGTVEHVQVFADTQPKVDIKLTAGAVTNTVHVTSAAPLLNTARADVSTILNPRALENLPNLNRNFTSFELLTPGTTYIGWNVGQSTNPQQSQQIEVNGQLPFATGYQLDGTDNQDPIQGVAVINPNLDAVSEMKVTSQNYDAEFGAAIGGMVTAQTKSGTNAFHGSAFEFRRSDAQQARDPFTEYAPSALTGKYISPNEQNMFGGSIGGPIKKNGIFFFGDYQGVRQKTGTSVQTTVPTALAHTTCTSGGNCNLSDYLNPALQGGSTFQIFDPTTDPASPAGRVPFADNIIPAGDVSAPAAKLISEMPMPNTGNGNITNNYVASGSGIFNTDQFDVRGDMETKQNFHSFGRYTRFNSTLSGAPYFGAAGGGGFGAGGFAGTDSAVDQSVAAGGDYVVSPTWVTDFRFGWFRIYLDENGPDYDQPLGNELGIPNANVGDLTLNGGLPQFQIDVPSNGSNNGSSALYGTSAEQYLQTENQFQVVDNWSHQLGNHSIEFGADLRYAMNHLVGLNNGELRSGNFIFHAAGTAGNAFGTTPGSSGLGYGTFLLGDVSNFDRTQTQNTNAQERQKRGFFFAQDQWRATPTLTVNYGLRWDIIFPETVNGKGQGGLLDYNTGDIRIAGYGPWGTNLNVGKDWTNFAPRIGLAWQARPNTVFRAGYGRAYGLGWSGNNFGEVLTFSYPTQVTQSLNSATNYSSVFALSQGPPGYTFAPIPASGNYPLPNGIEVPTRPLTIVLPTLDAWNLTLQQQLSPTMALQIGYVGSHGIHNQFDSSNQASNNQPTIRGFNTCSGVAGCPAGDINPLTGLPYTQSDRRPFYNGTAQTLGVTYGEPYGWTQDFRYNANQATSSYQAMQVVFNKSYADGVQLMANYTWSKARAHESDYYFINPRADYGNSYYNRPQSFVMNGNWNLPFGRGHKIGGDSPGWVNQIIGGFLLNGTWTWESGLPFTPSYQLCALDQDIDGQGGTLCRPNWAGPGESFQLKAGSFNPTTHSVSFFTPVALMATNGQVSGPFQRPQVATFGNIQRDSFYGPGLIDVDASIAKTFNLPKSTTFQLTAQAFNLFNHPNLGQPNGCVDCGGSSGLITDIVASQNGSSMRILQFAGKLQF